MQPLKFILGVLAILWIAAHLVEPLFKAIPSDGGATSWRVGKAVALVIGLMVAVVCFRPSKRED